MRPICGGLKYSVHLLGCHVLDVRASRKAQPRAAARSESHTMGHMSVNRHSGPFAHALQLACLALLGATLLAAGQAQRPLSPAKPKTKPPHSTPAPPAEAPV